MPFTTKLDYSDNRQIKQHIETRTVLSGASAFGVTFSALPFGPTNTGYTETNNPISYLSTFSGDNTTTVYTWYDARMQLGASSLSALTPSNSGITQNTGQIYVSNSTTTIDGHIINLSYTGVSFNVTDIIMHDLGGGTYSGSVTSNFFYVLSASSLDFKNRTIWVDVSGITRTEDLIITDNPIIGYVWGCVDGEGRGAWVSHASGDITITGGTYSNGTAIFTNNTGGTFNVTGFSSGSTASDTDLWISGSTGTNSIKTNNGSGNDATADYAVSEGYATLASGQESHAEGYLTSATTAYSHAEGRQTLSKNTATHAEGSTTTASGSQSHAEGLDSIASGSQSHAEGNATFASGTTSHAEGTGTTASGSYSHTEGNRTIASGTSAHAEGTGTMASGDYSHAEGLNTIASGFYAHSEGGPTGEGALSRVIASGSYSHAEGAGTTASGLAAHAEGLYSIASGTSSHAGSGTGVAGGDYSFVHAQGSKCYSNYSAILGGENHIISSSVFNSVILGGVSISATSDSTVYVPYLNIGSFVASGTTTHTIAVDANGNVGYTSSDVRLKENINTIKNALDKVKQLRGVTYNWKDRYNGGDNLRLGFIAQEVNNVIPELVFTNDNTEEKFMGVHYDTVTALLVEAVKELASGKITTGNVYLETQTIFAEDNDIQLNYSGTTETAIGGGVKILHAMGQDKSAEFITDSDGNWVTNNDFKSKALTIPTYTPSGSTDVNGSDGNLTRDDNYLYIKTSQGWKRTSLKSF